MDFTLWAVGITRGSGQGRPQAELPLEGCSTDREASGLQEWLGAGRPVRRLPQPCKHREMLEVEGGLDGEGDVRPGSAVRLTWACVGREADPRARAVPSALLCSCLRSARTANE